MKWGRHNRWNLDIARAKFLARTTRKPNGCIEWAGAIGSHKRYGVLGIAGRHWLAHRAAWFLFKGEDPADACVCHSCDNGLCVNVDHLFIGSQDDNVRDMENKKRSRHPSGADHGRAKLTVEQVHEIRTRHSNGEAIRALARAFGVSPPSISRIVRGVGWITTT